MEHIYQAAKDQCNDWDEADTDGSPISLEYVKKYYSLYGIYLSNYNEKIFIDLAGDIGDENGGLLLGDHAFYAEIDCSTEEITYSLQG